jgi:hypothetical protein
MTNAFFVFKLIGICLFLSIAFGLLIALKVKP